MTTLESWGIQEETIKETKKEWLCGKRKTRYKGRGECDQLYEILFMKSDENKLTTRFSNVDVIDGWDGSKRE